MGLITAGDCAGGQHEGAGGQFHQVRILRTAVIRGQALDLSRCGLEGEGCGAGLTAAMLARRS